MPPITFGRIPSLSNRFLPNLDFRNQNPPQPDPTQPNPAVNRIAATFQQPTPPVVQNLVNQPDPSQQPQQPQDDQPPDFMSQYNKIAGNRPQRLAYQDALTQGPEEIKRGKWAKLGALIAAAGSNLGGESPSAAANFGISAYQMPQTKADQDYKEKITRLGQSAGMEQGDISDQIKALEANQSDWYKRREDKRQQDQLGLQKQTTQAQIDNIHSEMDKRDTDEWTDPNSGIKWQRDKNNKLTQIGKVALTSDEQVKQAGAKAGAEADAQWPSEKKRLDAQAASAENVARIGATSRETVADKNAAAKMNVINARLQGVAKQMKPGDATTQVFNDVSQQFNSDKDLMGNDPLDYIKFETQPDGRVLIVPKPETTIGAGPISYTIPDSDEDKRIKAKVAKIVSDSYAKSNSSGRGGGASTIPLPPGFSIRK